MTKAELLERMKVKMLAYLEEQKGECELAVEEPDADDYDRDQLKRTVAHIDAVKSTIIIDPIFEAMESWDVPCAIMFIAKAAVDDPESFEGDGADIPMHWDT